MHVDVVPGAVKSPGEKTRTAKSQGRSVRSLFYLPSCVSVCVCLWAFETQPNNTAN